MTVVVSGPIGPDWDARLPALLPATLRDRYAFLGIVQRFILTARGA